jgi:hypothetical protein
MKRTLSTYEIAGLLMDDEYANWSRTGAYALAEYLEELEEDTGEEMEFDCVAIRCEWHEFKDCHAIAECYSIDIENCEDDEVEKIVLKYVDDRSRYIRLPANEGFIVQQF